MKKQKTPRTRSGRLTKADMGPLYALDHLLEQERRVEQRYALPFRAPHKVLTSLQQCSHCGKDIALLVFGDNARDRAGLEAYARMMAEPIQRTNLPTWIITPPADPSSLENPSLLLKVHPVREEAFWIVPDEWLKLIADLSDAHCRVLVSSEGRGHDQHSPRRRRGRSRAE